MTRNKYGKNTADMTLYAWIMRGKQREAVIRVMDRPKMPSRICKEAKEFNEKISLNSTSDVLRSLVEKGIAVCLNPNEKVRSLGRLPKRGKMGVIFKSSGQAYSCCYQSFEY